MQTAARPGLFGKIPRSQEVECKDTMSSCPTIRIEERMVFNEMNIQTTLV